MDEASTFTIGSQELKAEIARRGAELVRLQDEGGRDLLWDGDPAFWTGRAPLLFPIVGRLKNDHLTVGGVQYPMRQHGIARLTDFVLVAHEPAMCHLRLQSSPETRGVFPFDFILDVTYSITGPSLDLSVTVRNPGSGALPASVGFHPAFRWPLPYSAARSAHEVVFEQDEPEPLRQVTGGLLSPETRPTPVQGRVLRLRDDLFADDALIFLNPNSRSLRFGPPGGRGMRVDFPAMPQVALWTKPGAGFLCIEPWHGYASPEDFDGEFTDKPGLVHIPPGAAQTFGLSVHLDAA